jgi:hypothetical protein
MKELHDNNARLLMQPIDTDIDALNARLQWEEDLLSKPLVGLPDYDLRMIEGLLERRINESRAVIDTTIDLLNLRLTPEQEGATEAVMGNAHEVSEILERRLEKYIEDLRIVKGLLLKKASVTREVCR